MSIRQPQQVAQLFLDIETTGLDSERCGITEIGYIIHLDGQHHTMFGRIIAHPQPPSTWVRERTDYLSRIAPEKNKMPLREALRQLTFDVRSTGRGVILVGANPSSDDRFIRRAYSKVLGSTPPYLDQFSDVCSMAQQRFHLAAPPRLPEIHRLLGLEERPNLAPHTALADATEVAVVYYHLLNAPESDTDSRYAERVVQPRHPWPKSEYAAQPAPPQAAAGR